MKIRAIEVGIGECSIQYAVGGKVKPYEKDSPIITRIIENERNGEMALIKYYQVVSDKGLEIDIWYPTMVFYDNSEGE